MLEDLVFGFFSLEKNGIQLTLDNILIFANNVLRQNNYNIVVKLFMFFN